jgi:hypothetical protein
MPGKQSAPNPNLGKAPSMPGKQTAPNPNLGKAPTNTKPDLSTDSAARGATSGVKGAGATGSDVKPTGPRSRNVGDLAGGKTPDAKPDLNPGNIKKTTK